MTDCNTHGRLSVTHPTQMLEATSLILREDAGREEPCTPWGPGAKDAPAPAVSARVTPSNAVFGLGTFGGKASIQRDGELLGPQRTP